MTKLHLISTKVIPSHPSIHIIFGFSTNFEVENCTNPLFNVPWKLTKRKSKSAHQISGNLNTHHFKYGILNTFFSTTFPILILELVFFIVIFGFYKDWAVEKCTQQLFKMF